MYLVMRVAPFGYNLGCKAEREGDKVVETGAVLQRPGMSGSRGGRFVISNWETLKVFSIKITFSQKIALYIYCQIN